MNIKTMIAAATMAIAPAAAVQAQDVPAGYPADYAQIIEAAKAERKVLIYSNMSQTQWGPFLELAKATYPWLSVEAGDMGDDMWEKYYAESSSGVETADLMLTNSVDQWPIFTSRGQAVDYESPEKAALPDWSIPMPGVYTVSVDPTVLVYNRFLIKDDDIPKSRQDVLDLLKKRPDLAGKITTIDPAGNSLALGAFYALTKALPESWDLLREMGPAIRPERGAATVREKVMSGEYAVALMTSGGGIPQFERPEIKPIVGWLFPTDGVPASMRNIAITNGAKQPNAARLILDLILSREGQIAMSKGGQTAYRDDVAITDVPYITYNSVREQVGDDMIILIKPDADFAATRAAFLEKWTATLKGN